jgi:hypothetical protein
MCVKKFLLGDITFKNMLKTAFCGVYTVFPAKAFFDYHIIKAYPAFATYAVEVTGVYDYDAMFI